MDYCRCRDCRDYTDDLDAARRCSDCAALVVALAGTAERLTMREAVFYLFAIVSGAAFVCAWWPT